MVLELTVGRCIEKRGRVWRTFGMAPFANDEENCE